jgi:phosphonate transport system ATP-binding protein
MADIAGPPALFQPRCAPTQRRRNCHISETETTHQFHLCAVTRQHTVGRNDVLTVRHLNKKFGDVHAVNEVSFTVERPQMIGIIGRSGAGKSTLLRIINRLTEATSGEVMHDGNDVLSLRSGARRAWQRNCAMIFQQFNLVPRLDVLTNALLGRLNSHKLIPSLLKIFSPEERLTALTALDRLGIAEIALQRVETLSGGQQQRVAIARALVQDPKIILADEPIASLDPLNAKIVMESLRDIHDRNGLTVICNLHTLDTARQFCDRVIGMREGKVVFDGNSGDLTRSVARDIYGADDDFEESMTSTSIDTTFQKIAQATEVA